MENAILFYAGLGACLGALFGEGKRVATAIRFAVLFGAFGALLVANG